MTFQQTQTKGEYISQFTSNSNSVRRVFGGVFKTLFITYGSKAWDSGNKDKAIEYLDASKDVDSKVLDTGIGHLSVHDLEHVKTVLESCSLRTKALLFEILKSLVDSMSGRLLSLQHSVDEDEQDDMRDIEEVMPLYLCALECVKQ